MLHEVLGLQLTIFSRQFKLKSGINDNHRVIVRMPKKMWFREMETKEVGEKRQNAKETKAYLEAMNFANEARAKQVALFDSSNSSNGHRSFQARPCNDHEESRLSK